MKIATWNVNGVRARQAQLREWMERDRPDVVCLQELKAEPSQIPEQVKLEDYHAYWHGFRAYSGVSLHIRKGLFDAEPAFSHPEFDMESRILQAEVGRALDPDNPSLFTWWAPWRNLRQRNIGWRLDYILASPTIAERAASCAVLADVGTSDHAPVVMTGA